MLNSVGAAEIENDMKTFLPFFFFSLFCPVEVTVWKNESLKGSHFRLAGTNANMAAETKTKPLVRQMASGTPERVL